MSEEEISNKPGSCFSPDMNLRYDVWDWAFLQQLSNSSRPTIFKMR